jgi:hypothetical protein
VQFGGVDMIVDRNPDTEELNRICTVETNTSVGIDDAPTTVKALAQGLAIGIV